MNMSIEETIKKKLIELKEWGSEVVYINAILILYDLLNQYPRNIFAVARKILEVIFDIKKVNFYMYNEDCSFLYKVKEFNDKTIPDTFIKYTSYSLEPAEIIQGELAFPLVGNGIITSQLAFPKNTHSILGYMSIPLGEKRKDKKLIKFLLKYGRRIGPAIHRMLLISHLDKLNKKLEKVNKTYLNLIAFVSHELRGPLVGIGVDVKLILRGAYGAISENVKNILEHIDSRVSLLQSRINTYLNLASSELGGLRLQKTILDIRIDVIDQALDLIKNQLANKGMKIDYYLRGIPDRKVFIKGDKDKLISVYTNLFLNAIKYGKPGGKIAYGYEDKGNFYQFNVWNESEEIPKEKLSEMFKMFERFSQDKKINGYGIGLYLVNEIIKQHGGKIWVEAGKDWINFIFTLPKPPEEEIQKIISN